MMAKRNITTRTTPFFRANIDGQELFSVSEGIPVENALDYASCFLVSVIETLESLADEHSGESQFFTAIYLAQMAKAAVNASSAGVSELCRSQTDTNREVLEKALTEFNQVTAKSEAPGLLSPNGDSELSRSQTDTNREVLEKTLAEFNQVIAKAEALGLLLPGGEGEVL